MARRTFRSGRAWKLSTGQGIAGLLYPGVFLTGAVAAELTCPSWLSPPLIAAVPLMAIPTLGIMGAGAFTVLTAVVSFLLAVLGGWQETQEIFYGELIALSVIYAFGLVPATTKARRERAIERLRSVVETVQRAVLPPIQEWIGPLHTVAEYLAANKEAHIGGDLYDVLETPYGLRMIIGDVRGKGLPAVASANNLLGAFREAAPYAADLRELAERFDDSVRRYNRRVGQDTEEFITATLVSIPPRAEAEILCCGHPGPLLIRDGRVTQVDATRPSLPLGVGYLAATDCRVDTIPFDVGDRLLLYTDGVTEARDADGEFYPLAERVRFWAAADPRRLLHHLVRDLNDYTGNHLGDDAAILTCQRMALEPWQATGTGDSAAVAAPVVAL